MIRGLIRYFGNFLFEEIKENINKLDLYKPLLTEIIEKELPPSEIADRVIDFFKVELMKLLNGVFKKKNA